MARRFITAADVRRLVKQEGQTELVLGPDDVVTALALDSARDLGLRLVNHDAVPAWSTAGRHERLLKGPAPVPKPADPPSTTITADLVAQIVAEVLRRRGSGGRTQPGTHGPLRVDGRAPAAPAGPVLSGAWQQQEVIGAAQGGGMAAGFRCASAGTWTHTAAVNEMCYVVEGSVEVTFDGHAQRAYAGDVLFVPAGSQATYTTSSWVKLFCVTG